MSKGVRDVYIDLLYESLDDDSPECRRARAVVCAAGVLAQLRRGESQCACGWCVSGLTDADVVTAVVIVDAVETIVVTGG